MGFRVNLKDTPMEPGEYLADVSGTREITTKSGYPMVFIDWRIADGPEAGRLVSMGIAFVPQMTSRNNHLLKAMGQPYGEDLDIDPNAWHGVRCLVTVSVKEGVPEVTDLAPAEQQASGIGAEPGDSGAPIDPDEPPF